ncbi:MAG: hypothetical protein SPI65_04200 [Peptoniphilus sp.]|nr:hypothetical protein [Peptoniphilus sp.]MDD7363530.1 hypothetical protein [Bacillota bacterium]MDY6044767.1 hypothetical protein [Peptoniphilus sp.]
MDERVYLTIPAKPRYLSLARLAASGICVGVDIDMDTLSDIRLLLTESCNLSFELGGKDSIDLILHPEEEGLRFSVSGVSKARIEDDESFKISEMIIESLADELTFGDDKIIVYKKFEA